MNGGPIRMLGVDRLSRSGIGNGSIMAASGIRTTAVDIVVLGMGPGGEVVANKLAEAGLDVVGVDERLVGGECAYWGCVPSKMMLRAAKLLAEAERVNGLAGEATVSSDWAPVAERVRDATSDWDDTEAIEPFEDRGGRFVRGRGHLVGPDRVQVGGEVFEARRGIVIATGTSPMIPPIDGLADTPYWTNRDAIETDRVPDSLVVLGGGAIGCELSQVFARFGAEVTIVEAESRLQHVAEPEAGEIVRRALERDGIEMRLGCQAVRVDHHVRDDPGDQGDQEDGSFSIELDDGDIVTAERLLVVTGRDTALDRLGVDAIGLDPDAGHLTVDERCRVTDRVWAIGDVTGEAMFTHVARHHATIVIADVFGEEPRPRSTHAIPRVTFTDPELAAVGSTEQQARDAGVDVAIGVTHESSRAWLTDRGDDVVIKVVADRDRSVLVGATAVGPSAGEVLGLLALAVHARTPIEQLSTMVHAYPTYSRAIDDAIDALGSLCS